MYNADALKGKQTRELLASAMADLTGHIENIEEALEGAADTDLDADDREDNRETAVTELDELFTEFDRLRDFCDSKLMSQ